MCECFASVVSAVAAHTELVRTLTTAPPAKRQPASSTGNMIKIMSLLRCITHQCQLILSQSILNSPETSPGKKKLLKMFHFTLFLLSFPRLYHLFSTSFFFVLFFISFPPGTLLSLPFSPTLIIVLLIKYIPIILKNKTMSDPPHQH